MNLLETIHYCKADKKTGKPVIVTDKDGNARNTNRWSLDLFDEAGNPVRLEVEFNNSAKKAKSQGATTILKVFK